jgi:LacI family transcriptional regulator
MTPRPSLRDVALAAGVSHMTVSRVVRGTGGISPATRERVDAAIRKLDYRPDPALSALAAYRTRAGGGRGSRLAFLFCDVNPYSRQVYEGAGSEAERLGYGVETHVLGLALSTQRNLNKVLYHRGNRGLLFGPSQTARTFSGWDWRHFAPVSLGAAAHQPPMSRVAMDYFNGVIQAEAHLRGMGARKVGLAIDPALELRTGHRWLGGFIAGHHPEPSAVYSGDPDDKLNLLRWFRREKPDGVMTIHKAVWQTLQPKGVKFVFLNTIQCPKGVPHVALEPGRIGQEAVRLIHHQILNHEFGLGPAIKAISLQGTIQVEPQ